MRKLEEWDRSDLQALIDNDVRESLTLDYKRSRALAKSQDSKSELAKDVSALANSAGGMIVYGIAEAEQKPTHIDEGIDPKIITREWIEQVLNSCIRPRIAGIAIKEIDIGEGMVSYIINIPAATSRAPHQSLDHKYYRRHNFQSITMEDYEIRDVMRRSTKSEPYIKFAVAKFHAAEDGAFEAEITALISNRTSEPVLYATAAILLDERLVAGRPGLFNANQQFRVSEIQSHGANFKICHYTKNHSVPGSMPIYKEITYTQGREIIKISEGERYAVGYSVTCPGYSFYTISIIEIIDGGIHEFFEDGPSLFSDDG